MSTQKPDTTKTEIIKEAALMFFDRGVLVNLLPGQTMEDYRESSRQHTTCIVIKGGGSLEEMALVSLGTSDNPYRVLG